MDILALLRGSPGAQAWMAQQGPALGALGISPREQLDREMSYDGSHPRQQEQEAINAFRGYGPQMLMDAFIPGYGAGGDAKAASEAYGEGRYGAAALNAGMAALDFVPVLGALPAAAKGIRAFHGSPHDFDRFDMSKIGGGEGVQAEGYGLYFAENPQVAQRYRDRVRDADGRLYEVNIDASPGDFVDWNAPLGGQPPRVREWFDNRGISEGFAGNQSGMELLMAERGALGDRGVAESMRDAGIPGIKYLDAGSRGAGDGSRNYVVFDDRLITILRKYGIGGLIAGGGAYALTDAEYAQAAELLAQDGMNTGAQ